MERDEAWIGGRRQVGSVSDGSGLVLALLIDSAADRFVDGEVFASVSDADFGAFFERACKAPRFGAPRMPRRLSVEDPIIADEVRARGLDVEVEVVDLPQLSGALDGFLDRIFAVDDERDARPTMSFVGKPWRPAPRGQWKKLEPLGARLLSAAPWKRIDEDVPIRVSAPRLGLQDGVVNVFGVLGQSPGLSVFRSPKHLRSFLRAASEHDADRQPPPLEDAVLTLSMEPRKRGLPEVTALHVRADWRGLDADHNELALLVAIAEALVRLGKADTVTHEGVTLTVNAGTPVVPIRRATQPPAKLPQRNDPCWCGSGKKYKKCHLDRDADEARAADDGSTVPPPGRSRWGAVLDRMYPRVLAWCRDNVRGFVKHLDEIGRELVPDLALSHAIFVMPIEARGPTPGEQYRARAGARLDDDERRWLDANIEHAWTSYWTVLDVEPGRSITLEDIFSKEVRTVIEASASRMAALHDLLCGRVVTVADATGAESYLDICHPRSLGPAQALFLREKVAVILGLTKKKAVPVATLRKPVNVAGLVFAWVSAVEAVDAAHAQVKLVNTDGEPLVFVSERFALTVPRADVKALLTGMDRLTPDDDDGDAWSLSKSGNATVKAWDQTTVARLTLEADALVVETNSRQRATAVAEALRALLGGALGASAREEQDAEALKESASREPSEPRLRAAPPPEVQAALRQFKERTYANWADEPVPALGDKTPREAMKTAEGRRRVASLIDEYERHEHRELPAARFDCDLLRRAVGLPTRGG